MSQRIRVLEELGSELERAVRADTGPRRPVRRRIRGLAPVASAVLVTAVVGLAGLLLLRPAGPRSPYSGAGAAGLRALLSRYAVLRRPQTPADRSESGPAPVLGGTITSRGVLEPRQPGAGHRHFTVRITGLPRYVDIPSLTRVVDADGLRLALFVERLLPARGRPKVTLGGDHRGFDMGLRRVAHARYLLLARVGSSGQATPIGGGALGASLQGPHGVIAAVVPDRVSELTWVWPREFAPAAVAYLPPVTVSAPVTGNVAAAPGPARFGWRQPIGPATVVEYDGDRVTARLSDPANSPSQLPDEAYDPSTPAPETAQSRRAERDPSTPNRVVLVPGTLSLQSIERLGARFYFRVLLSHRRYEASLTGGPRPGCLGGAATMLAQPPPWDQPDVRGDTYEAPAPTWDIRCRGIYRLSVSVLGAGRRPYPPFGSAELTVR